MSSTAWAIEVVLDEHKLHTERKDDEDTSDWRKRERRLRARAIVDAMIRAESILLGPSVGGGIGEESWGNGWVNLCWRRPA